MEILRKDVKKNLLYSRRLLNRTELVHHDFYKLAAEWPGESSKANV